MKRYEIVWKGKIYKQLFNINMADKFNYNWLEKLIKFPEP